MTMPKKPVFIVFEGLDGSGTSTQAQRLVELLANTRTRKSRLTSEPSGGPVGQLIRTAMSGRLRLVEDRRLFDRQMAYLFAADRHDHLFNDTNGVMKLLESGYSVVSTRYYFSSYAYHCTQPGDFEFVSTLNACFPEPDLAIYLDVPVEVSISRLGARSNLDAYENHDKLQIVRSNYEKYFASYKGRLLRVPGTLGSDEVHARVKRAVEELGDVR